MTPASRPRTPETGSATGDLAGLRDRHGVLLTTVLLLFVIVLGLAAAIALVVETGIGLQQLANQALALSAERGQTLARRRQQEGASTRQQPGPVGTAWPCRARGSRTADTGRPRDDALLAIDSPLDSGQVRALRDDLGVSDIEVVVHDRVVAATSQSADEQPTADATMRRPTRQSSDGRLVRYVTIGTDRGWDTPVAILAISDDPLAGSDRALTRTRLLTLLLVMLVGGGMAVRRGPRPDPTDQRPDDDDVGDRGGRPRTPFPCPRPSGRGRRPALATPGRSGFHRSRRSAGGIHRPGAGAATGNRPSAVSVDPAQPGPRARRAPATLVRARREHAGERGVADGHCRSGDGGV